MKLIFARSAVPQGWLRDVYNLGAYKNWTESGGSAKKTN
jgi:hypothetical protein